MKYYYVYILQSLVDGKFYTGYTSDLTRRLEEHNNGKSVSTKWRRPLRLVYFEGCGNIKDAMKREKYLKTTYGKRYIKNRLSNFLANDIAQGAEGSSRISYKDKAHFTQISFGSLMELLCQMIISEELGYIDEKHLFKIRENIEEISNKLNSLRNYQLN